MATFFLEMIGKISAQCAFGMSHRFLEQRLTGDDYAMHENEVAQEDIPIIQVGAWPLSHYIAHDIQQLF
ncbi:hypothetical protein NA66_1001689 [Burkholderia pyrrocinia]|uniref:Uncharacterized protein n=1 Tax=Burkholderia pyrrocinia TaxID=60550 RepID=A0A318IZZ4_BURPY|nr:hypothetical protein NA66_1001689 [Burkholderia pyrrocinia]SFW58048.1 hypothetical protein SAMN03159384_03006 [Burkholderia sp. NFACC33-1]SFY11085.1 hypothetical protein SAMN03159408_03218 [Burkholderia sp. NFPP32]